MQYSSKFTTSFPKLIAKIAYCFSVAKFGYEAMREADIISSIFGRKDNIGYWVGCEHACTPESLPIESFLHRVTILENNNIVSANVRLFALLHTPEYLVIVGNRKQ
jgi:hypothetical protein